MTGQLQTDVVGHGEDAPLATRRVPSTTSRLPLGQVFPPAIGLRSEARGRDSARSTLCPKMSPGTGTGAEGARTPRGRRHRGAGRGRREWRRERDPGPPTSGELAGDVGTSHPSTQMGKLRPEGGDNSRRSQVSFQHSVRPPLALKYSPARE